MYTRLCVPSTCCLCALLQRQARDGTARVYLRRGAALAVHARQSGAAAPGQRAQRRGGGKLLFKDITSSSGNLCILETVYSRDKGIFTHNAEMTKKKYQLRLGASFVFTQGVLRTAHVFAGISRLIQVHEMRLTRSVTRHENQSCMPRI